jgi:spermidine synthase
LELWYTEKHTPNVGITLKIKRGLLHKDTPFQRLDVLESFDFGRVMLLDGLVMLTERDEFVYHEMISHVPLVAHPCPKRVLIIGGGDGGTVREILRHPEVERIDLVEIDREVIDASIEYFPEVSCGLNDPKAHIFVEDGIQYIARQHNVYDAVIIDSTDPIGPAEGLFVVDFYKDVHKALKPDGIMVTQSESPFQHLKIWGRIQRDISSVFPRVFSYCASIPTYPSGFWSFTIGAKTLHPVEDMREESAQRVSRHTRYYNPSLHRGAFALPNFLLTELESTA